MKQDTNFKRFLLRIMSICMLFLFTQLNAQFVTSKIEVNQNDIHWKKEVGQGVMRTFISSMAIDGNGSGKINKITYNYNGDDLSDLDSIWLCRADKWDNPKEFLQSVEISSANIEFAFNDHDITETQYYVLFAFISPTATLGNIVDIEPVSVTIDDTDFTAIDVVDDKYLEVKENLASEINIDAGNLYETLGQLETYGAPEGGCTIIVNDDTELTKGIDLNTTFLPGRPVVIKRSNTGINPPIVKHGVNYGSIMGFEGVNNVTWDGIDIEATRDDAKYGITVDDWANKVFCSNIVVKNSKITMQRTGLSFNSGDMRGSAMGLFNSDGDESKYHSNISFDNNTLTGGMCGVFLKGTYKSLVPDVNIRNNTITDMSHYGIYIGKHTKAKNLVISENTIGDFIVDHAENGGEVQGIGSHEEDAILDTAVIESNRIFDISNNNADCYRLRGINISEPLGGVLVANNMVYNIAAPNSNKQDGDNNSRPATVAGISTRGADNESRFYVYHNTVVIDYTTTQDNNRSTAFEAEKLNSAVPVHLANNIFVNNSDHTGSINNYCYATFTSDEAGSFNHLMTVSNNNLYVSKNGHIAGQSNDQSDGNDDAQFTTLADYKTQSAPRESNSVTEDISATVPFKDISNGDLTVSSTTNSSLVNGGVALTVISKDFEGESRSKTTPYIGADEYNNNTTLELSSTQVTEEGETMVTITATSMDNVNGDQTIEVNVSGDDIIAGDYALSSTNLVIQDGTKTGSVTFSAIDDNVIEFTETATISFTPASSGITLLNTSLEVEIINNDFPVVNISLSANDGNEADQTEITVTATAEQAVDGNQEMDVLVTGTEITFGDYQLSNEKIIIIDGQTSGTVTFTVVDDDLVEHSETATIAITGLSSGIVAGTTLSQDVVLESDDNPVVSISVESNEGNESDETQIIITATATAPVIGDQTVDISASGEGITAADYKLSSTSFDFAEGTVSREIILTILNDNDPEGSENILLTLMNPSAGLELGTSELEIQINDDDVSYLSLFADKTSVSESDDNLTVTLTIAGNRSIVGDQSVELQITGQGITADDYILPQTTIDLLDGENQKDVILEIEDDLLVEPAETLTVSLINPSTGVDVADGSVDIEILSDDKPEVSLSVDENTGTEDAQTEIIVTATLSEAAVGVQQVEIEVGGVKTESYSLANSTLSFNEGETSSSTTFNVIDDDLIEIDDEVATLTLTNPSAGIIMSSDISKTITIVDNEEPLPVVTLSVDSDSTFEKNEEIITVTATTDKPVVGMQSIQLTIGGSVTNMEDCILSSNTITINDQESSGTTSIVIIDDQASENEEMIELTVASASEGLDISNAGKASIKLADDEITSVKNQLSGEISIYPNPVDQDMTISGIRHMDLIKIQSLSGQMVKVIQTNNQESARIEMDDLPSGSYNVQIISQSGELHNKTIIKQ